MTRIREEEDYTIAVVVIDYWLTQHAFLNEDSSRAFTVFSFNRDHMSVTVCPMDEKSLSDCAELTGMHRSLRSVSDIIGCSVASFSQNCSGLLKADGTFRDLGPVCQVNAVSTRMLRFSRAVVFLYRQHLVQTFIAETRLRALQLRILTNVYLSCLPSPRQLSRYSSPAANCQLALASALPVADVLSFEYDGINVTSQHVMAQTYLWCTCSPFTTSSSKTIVLVKFRRIDYYYY